MLYIYILHNIHYFSVSKRLAYFDNNMSKLNNYTKVKVRVKVYMITTDGLVINQSQFLFNLL